MGTPARGKIHRLITVHTAKATSNAIQLSIWLVGAGWLQKGSA